LAEPHIYKIVEITGTSQNTMEEAIRNAIKKVSESVGHLRWFKVTETRGDIEGGDVKHWQVTIKIGFTVESTLE